MKVLDVDKDGIWTLEPTIMNTISSPFLTQAESTTYFPPSQGHNRLAPYGEIQLQMQLAEADLATWLKKNNPSTDQMVVWAHDLLQGLWALHSNNIVHADVKTANILVYADGSVKLADFSAACWLASRQAQAKLYTPTNRPPEIWAGSAASPAADLWALGCTLLEVVAKMPPIRPSRHEGDHLSDLRNLLQALGHKPEQAPAYQSSHAPQVRAQAIASPLYSLIRRLLHPQPDQRGTIPELLQVFFNSGPIPATVLLPETLPLNEVQLLELEKATEGASSEVRELTRQMLEIYSLQRPLLREIFSVAYCLALKFITGELILIPEYYTLELDFLQAINFCIG